MNSQEYRNLQEAYLDVYRDKKESNIYESILNICISENLFDTLDECKYFSKSLILENLVEDFVEYYGLQNLNENPVVKYALDPILNRLGRLGINALSSSARSRIQGLNPLTALGRNTDNILTGGAASTSIRAARAQRTPVVPERPERILDILRNRTPPTPPTPPFSIFTVKPNRTGAPEPAFDKFQSSLIKQPDWMKFQDKYQKLQRPPSDRLVQARVAAQKDKLGAAGILGTVGTAGVLSGVNSIPNSTKKDPNLSVGKFNTMDPSGKIRNRKVVGPEEVGPEEVGPKKVGTIAQAFDKSYSSAKKDGLKSFNFKGGTYSTESYDLYDTILEHLITEGYADTNENALVIMANMSEDWKQSIMEDEYKGDPRKIPTEKGGSPSVGPNPKDKLVPPPIPVLPPPTRNDSTYGTPSPPSVGGGSIRSMPSPPSGGGSISRRDPYLSGPRGREFEHGNGGTKYTTPTKDGSAGSITLNNNIPGDDFIGPTLSRGGKTYGIPNPKFVRPQR